MIGPLTAIETLTLFVEDLAEARRFYTQALSMAVIFADEVSVVLRMNNIMINLLHISAAPELVTPLHPGSKGDGPRSILTVLTSDAEALCLDLTQRGVEFLNGPIDRPWGRRTAAFADPAGVVWEIAQKLPG